MIIFNGRLVRLSDSFCMMFRLSSNPLFAFQSTLFNIRKCSRGKFVSSWPCSDVVTVFAGGTATVRVLRLAPSYQRIVLVYWGPGICYERYIWILTILC